MIGAPTGSGAGINSTEIWPSPPSASMSGVASKAIGAAGAASGVAVTTV